MHLPSPLRKSPRRNTAAAPTGDSLQPPSSFSRSGTTFKDSIRKIPSTIFTRDRKDKMDKPPSPTKVTEKKKTKTRKALGGLFGWASHAQPDPPTPPPKSTISRPVPAPQPTLIPRKPVPPMPASTSSKLDKRPSILSFRSPNIIKQPSLAKLPSIAKLDKRVSRSNLAPTTPNVARSSMSEDPFSCDAGAEIVHRVTRQSVCTPSVRSEATARERRRDSTFSDKASQGDEASVHEVAMRARMSSPRRVTIASVLEEKKRLSAQSVQSASSHASSTLVDRRTSGQSYLSSNTFGKPMHVARDTIEIVSDVPRGLPSPRSVMFERPLPAPPVQRVPLAAPPSAFKQRPVAPAPAAVQVPTPVVEQRLNKVKTRSRVWGFLGKKKDSGSPTEVSRPLTLGTTVQAPERPVPVLHVSHPSVDVPRNALDGERPNFEKRDSVESSVSSQATRKGLPKRKSLHGVFDLDIQRTASIVPDEPVTSRSEASIQNWQPPTIRPLSEEMAEVTFGKEEAKPVKDLRRVASATDKLISLVSSEFSPACSPTTATLANMASFSSLKGDATPTPVRRAQSVLLIGASPKKVTPPRPTSQLSPIKLALERARVRKMEGISMVTAEPGLPPNTPPKHHSLVKSGMRNVFAPPSPVKESVSLSPAKQSSPARSSIGAATIIRRPGHGPTTGLAGFIGGKEEMVGSLPADLYHMLAAAQAFAEEEQASPVASVSAGASERATTPAPGISLPPVPDVFADSPDDSSEEGEGDVRQSFDFEAHFEQLDSGDRQSFLAALHRAESRTEMARPPLPPLPTTLYTIEQSPISTRSARTSDEPRRNSPARARKAPFQGTFAFQQQVSKSKAPSPLATSPPVLPLPPVPTHQRNTSTASFASMSSMGDVLDSAETMREYTNYFDVNFGQHLAHAEQPQDGAMGAHSRNPSVESNVRAPTRRHHRRNSSIVSTESFGMEQLVQGPPNARFNKHRSGYVSRHRVNGSYEGSWGRSDWAAHKRNTSSDSTASNASLARIGRPGLGERMFMDNGIVLSSIEGSPADMHVRQQSLDSIVDVSPTKTEDSIVDNANPANATFDSVVDAMHKPSFDSIIDAPDASFDSQVHRPDPDFTAKIKSHRRTDTWESSDLSAVESKRSSATTSIFGPDLDAGKGGFFLKGVRPVSAISRSESENSDAFIDVAKYASKEVPARRRKPAHIVVDRSNDTPGLSSPCTSDTSFMSLDTHRDAHIFGPRPTSTVKPQATIVEEPSSATLKPKSLVNQLSRDNLRHQNLTEWDEEDDVENVTSWLRFQREASDVCRRTRSFYRDSEESKAAVADFATNFTPQSVAAFIAQSTQAYRPLESAHRRRPSFSNSRATSSPYGLPLPKASVPCKPRGSLTTKFERSNSAQSRHSLGPSEGSDTPTSGIFDGFMPELKPAQRRSTPPGVVMARPKNVRKGSSPPTFAGFAQNPSRLSAPPITASTSPNITLLPEHQTAHASPSTAARQRVSSCDRRKALGWGRRRESDGPQKLEPVPAVPLALARTSNVHYAPRVPINSAPKPKVLVVAPSPAKAPGPVVYRDEGVGKENAVFARPKPSQGRVSSRRTGNRTAMNQRALRV